MVTLYVIVTNIHHDYLADLNSGTPWENYVVSVWDDKEQAYMEYSQLMVSCMWSNHPDTDCYIINECELNEPE